MFVSDCLVDGPKVGRGIDIGRGGFQLLDRTFQPEAEQSYRNL
jgi:hypothetical protein